jgi:hypothetical protein
VRAALRRAGYPAAIINTVVFPAARLRLGDGADADELKVVLRIGMPESSAAINNYLQQAASAITVLRVTPRSQADIDPFPVPQLRVRGTGATEMDLVNTLDLLRQGIMEANPGLIATDIQTMPNWFEGADYIQRWHDPWADSRDALFLTAGNVEPFGSTGEVTLTDDEFLMVYGVNHVATGKATYMSVNAYASEKAKMSIGQVFYDALAGTAVPYLPPGDPTAEMMYAYKVSRNC